MRDEAVRLPLDEVHLIDARTGAQMSLAELPGVWVLTLLRHRY